MKETIRDSMTVALHSPHSGSDEDNGEIHVGSVILSEIAGRELVTVDPQQDLDGMQRLQARHHVRRRPVVEANDEVIGSVVQNVIAVHASAERRRDAVKGISR
jgi:CBS-domain-containing membrane protein